MNGTNKRKHAEPEFRRGAIRRLRMQNFMTHTDAEIVPGHGLNVICGFNGSGKSAIVLAIGLALGGKLASLMRADQTEDFIKHGASFAQIDIELHQGMPDLSHAHITRKLEAGVSEWHLNGKRVAQKAITELTAALMIQVDNMCVFLSQHKVREFSQLTPIEFLDLTETACNPRLKLLHVNLTDLKHKQLAVVTETKDTDATMTTLLERKKGLEADVEIYQRKEEFTKKRALLLRKRPWIVYGNAKEQAALLKERLGVCKENLATEEKRLAPLKHHLNERMNLFLKAEAELKRIDTEFERLDAQRKEHGDGLETQEARQEEAKVELESLERRKQERDTRLAALQKEIDKARANLEAIPSDQQAEDKYAEVQRECENLRADIDEMEEHRRSLERRLNEAKKTERDLRLRIEELQDVKERRLRHAMERTKIPYLLDLFNWVQRATKEAKFVKRVFGPIFLELEVANNLHAKYLDHVMSIGVKLAYIVQTKQDWALLTDTTKRFKWPVQVIDGGGPISKPLPKPIILPEDIPGVQGSLASLLENCTEEVKKALCSQCVLHELAYTEEQSAPADMYKMLAKNEQDMQGVRTLLSPEDCFSVRFSKYGGPRIVQCSRLNPPTGLFAPVDNSQLSETQTLLAEAQKNQKVLESELNATSKPKEAKEQEATRLRDLLHELSKSKSRRKGAFIRLQHAEEKLKQAQEADSHLEKKQAELSHQVSILMNARMKKVQQLKTVVHQWATVALSRAGHILNKTQHEAIARQLQDQLDASSDHMRKLKSQVSDAEKAFAAKVKECTELKAAAQKATPLYQVATGYEEFGPPNATFSDLFRKEGMPDTLDEIDALTAQLEAQASAVVAQHGVMQQFAELNSQISELETKKREAEHKQSELETEIKKHMEEWLPALTNIVYNINEEFSNYFAAIGCKGETRLSSGGDDFGNYALELLVSFRASAPLQRLSNFQSGGERSVATMLFLLCLQKVTDCPFRVVDEINQAMDPPNERMIFSQISNSSRTAGTPQYFLVTPKLLPGLVYTDQTTIHFVYNGAWLKTPKWNMDEMIKIAKTKS